MSPDTAGGPDVAGLLRDLAPQVLAAVLRRYGDLDTGEDAVQEALLAAAVAWPVDGIPPNPGGWLVTVASRRWIDRWRRDTVRRRREHLAAHDAPAGPPPVSAVDDSLTLLLLCCHPVLTRGSQVALTLRAVGGLSTAEVARLLLVPEATAGQRISRAKARIRASGATFTLPGDAELPERVTAVAAVLYLMFTEGSTASSGTGLHRQDLSGEAIRLTRVLRTARPGDGEVAGLLALMLLTDARRPARTTPGGHLVPLDEQDRTRWDTVAVDEGIALVTWALAVTPVGPYQLQAAIAALHDEAATVADTDWPQILALYELLRALTPGPMVTLNAIVARAMVHGPRAGLDALAAACGDPVLAAHHRTAAVRAHLLERDGDHPAAREQYLLAARGTLNLAERDHLHARAQHLDPASPGVRSLDDTADDEVAEEAGPEGDVPLEGAVGEAHPGLGEHHHPR